MIISRRYRKKNCRDYFDAKDVLLFHFAVLLFRACMLTFELYPIDRKHLRTNKVKETHLKRKKNAELSLDRTISLY